ncbi:flagellar basal body-associated protein FliL [Desulfurobacterium thermolithotrophum DSM 11699]|uniref:Flagellar protein FliL n=1 Tax=Desulfurobacterium thermolithotrophum (strain DSM 11699 / BSA) TaxID=868864 RepID=F0S0S0_DESTD|nr:flagellar basal body-associated FliL family protein [Desulfurobacterium thermolithotrophum]ADY73873.1 flagellar basal body-associated protein FliL [Desulfurobacterium thermolithotrophum DSM 11699]
MAEEEKQEQEQKGSGKKKFIILIVLLLLLGIGGGVAYKFLVLDKKKVESQEKQAQRIIEEIKATEKVGVMFDLGTFVVNLADTDIERYLKVSIVLELKDQKIQAEAQKRLPEIKDAITTLLLTKKSSEIRTPEGIEFLKEEIAKRVNAILPLGGVKNVYFTEFIIQTG